VFKDVDDHPGNDSSEDHPDPVDFPIIASSNEVV
jgi:hypothetical protein